MKTLVLCKCGMPVMVITHNLANRGWTSEPHVLLICSKDPLSMI